MQKENMKFEEAMDALEEITARLETGALALDDAIGAYEEACRLIKICNERLEVAEKKVRLLTPVSEGEADMTDFRGNDEN
ncbi:MAG: exodeoxyribonuclease VII small subunit [Clostridia bacterium]|nr:exodeoxyribonuclease VII small subunit [Clostridia bacterium]